MRDPLRLLVGFFAGLLVCCAVATFQVVSVTRGIEETSRHIDEYAERLLEQQHASDMSTSWPTGDSVRTIRTPHRFGWSVEQWRDRHFEEIRRWQDVCPLVVPSPYTTGTDTMKTKPGG